LAKVRTEELKKITFFDKIKFELIAIYKSEDNKVKLKTKILETVLSGDDKKFDKEKSVNFRIPKELYLNDTSELVRRLQEQVEELKKEVEVDKEKMVEIVIKTINKVKKKFSIKRHFFDCREFEAALILDERLLFDKENWDRCLMTPGEHEDDHSSVTLSTISWLTNLELFLLKFINDNRIRLNRVVLKIQDKLEINLTKTASLFELLKLIEVKDIIKYLKNLSTIEDFLEKLEADLT
jgi:hypothetical protein